MMLRVALMMSCFALGCSGTARPATTEAPASATRMAPTPYTAEQIRDATHAGRTYTYRVEAPGEPTVFRTMQFVGVTPEGTDVSVEMRDEHDAVVTPAAVGHSSWQELRSHALFPADAVTLTEQTITTPAGTYACTAYVVRSEPGQIDRFYFAHGLPGPPVRFETERSGVRVRLSVLIRYADSGGASSTPSR